MIEPNTYAPTSQHTYIVKFVNVVKTEEVYKGCYWENAVMVARKYVAQMNAINADYGDNDAAYIQIREYNNYSGKYNSYDVDCNGYIH